MVFDVSRAKKRFTTKKLAFIGLMGALGNVLFLISQSVARYAQVALDLSHIATFISALCGGPLIGGLTGLIVGVGPGIAFGPAGGLGFLGLWGLPVGKALTGLSVGLLYKLFRAGFKKHAFLFTVLVVSIGFIPECLFMVFFFLVLVKVFLPSAYSYLIGFLTPILCKAWLEVIVMAFLTGILEGVGVLRFIRGFLSPKSRD